MRLAAGLLVITLFGCGSEPEPEPPSITNIGARLHDEIRSLVYITWNQSEGSDEAWVEYQLTGEDTVQRTPSAAAGKGSNEALVVGIPYETEFTFTIYNDFGNGPVASQAATVETGNQPNSLPVPEINTADPSGWDTQDNYLLGSINEEPGGWTGGTYWKWIVDREGRFVWASKTKQNHWSIFLRTSVDGTHILWDDASYWSDFDLGSDSKVHRMLLDGTILSTHDTPGLHHAFTELPDGSLVYGSAGWYNEVLVEQAPDGSEQVLFDCLDFEESIGYDGPYGGYYGGYCQSNTLYYHEASDSFLYSFYTSSSVLEVDRSTGEVIRYFGGLPGGYEFDPPESQFYFQHGAAYTPDGTLLLSSHQSYFDVTGVVREYAIDDASQTLTEVWNQGLDGPYDSPTAGEAHRLTNGNTIHNYGASPVVQEIQPDGTVVWEIAWESSRLIGRTVFMNDLYDYVAWPETFAVPAE